MTEGMEVDQQPSSDINDPAFVSTLPEPLRGYALHAFSLPHHENKEACSGDVSSKLDQLEISTRSHLLELVEQLLTCQEQDQPNDSSSSSNDNIPENSSIETLLQYLKNVTLLCLHVAHHNNPSKNRQSDPLYSHIPSTATIIKKLPFLLLEDAVDSLPLLHIQSLWGPSPQFPTLCISSYTTNLLCSSLIFVSASRFVLLRICNKLLKVLSNRDVDAEFAGSLMMVTAKVFPLSERSAVNVLGSFNVRNETVYEDEQEFNGKINTLGKQGGEGDDRTKPKNIGYDFYKTFWGVQKVFTNPQGTILPSRGRSHAEAATEYNGFMKDITSILVALESTPVLKSSSPGLGLASSQLDRDGASSTATSNTVRHHKYLTSSQLLHLQLKDAKLRVQFLTQLIIILSYLISPTVVLPTPPITPTPGADTVKLASQIKLTQTKQLDDALKRTQSLLRATCSPLGESMLRSLQWLLRERESLWTNWKKGKCLPAMDKVGGGVVSGAAIMSKLSGRKRKVVDNNGRSSVRGGEAIPQIASLPKTSLPALSSFLDPYVEALDPENGIEGEYHPRNDNVYCWRARRLMARDQQGEGQLRRFAKLRRRDGDFEGMVRDMWKDGGEEIGGTMPSNYYDVKEDRNADKGGADLEMDDAASVGSPEEDVQAKKEQMAQFEKAAMEVEEEMLNEEVTEGGNVADDTKIVTKEQRDGATSKEKETKDTMAETIEYVVSEDPKKKAAKVKKELAAKEDSKPSKVETNTTATQAKNTDRSKPVAEYKNGGKKDENTSAPKYKAPIRRIPTTAAVDTSTSNGKMGEQPRSSSPPRAKFTPPPPKSQPQQQLKNESRDNNPRGRYQRRRNFDNERNNTDHQPQQQVQPSSEKYRDNSADGQYPNRTNRAPPAQKHSQNQRDNRSFSSSHNHGGSSKNSDNGRGDYVKRDGKSHSPPNSSTGGGGGGTQNNPPPGKGTSGKANDGAGGGSSNAAPHAGGGGAARGRFEPPPPRSGGGGSVRGRGGGRGSYRGRNRQRR